MEALERVKEVICQIIAAAGGRLEGKRRLYKAFYFAHLFYWQRGQGILTQHPIVRMLLGPGIDQGSAIMEDDELFQVKQNLAEAEVLVNAAF